MKNTRAHFLFYLLFCLFLFTALNSFSQATRQWATYYGGTHIEYASNSVKVDGAGNIYIAGYTFSTGGIASPGAHQTVHGGGGFDAFVAKFDPCGSRLWATYYGSTGDDRGLSLAIDGSNNVFLAGETYSGSNIASGGFQNTYGGGNDAFLVKFDSNGNRQWATYYGGSGDEGSSSGEIGTATDIAGNVYLTGVTTTPTGMATAGGFQNTFGGFYDGFLVKFDAAGNRLWATYYGGAAADWGWAVATDQSANVFMGAYTLSGNNIASAGGFQNTYAGNYDAYLVKFDSGGNRQWATYYGGTQNDWAWGLATDATGNSYLSGMTANATGIASGGFQNTYGGNFDAYLVKFDPSGNRQWATYYGGTDGDEGNNVETDAAGNVYLTGDSYSSTGIASGGFQNTYNPSEDWFVAKFDANGNRLCATYYGGVSGTDEENAHSAVDASGNIYLSGSTPAPGISTAGCFQPANAGNGDDFLVKLGPCTCIPPVITMSPNVTICSGQPVSISASAPATSCSANTYSWSPSGTLNNSTISNPTASPSTTTTYTCTVTDGTGCTNTGTVSVTIGSLSITVGGAGTICSGQSATLNASGGTTYVWTTGASTSAITVSPTTTTNYTVSVSNGSGCTKDSVITVTVNSLPTANAGPDISMCSGSTTTLNATGNGNYSWSPATGLSCTTCPNPVCSTTTNTSYTLTVTNSCGTATDIINVTTPASPSANAGTPATICIGNSTTLSGSGSGTFVWSPATGLSCTSCANPVANPTATTTYTLSITAPCGTNTASVTVTVNPLPAINAGTDVSICTGSNTTLNATGSGTYLWTPSSGLSCTTCANPIASPTITTSYTVTATNNCGSKSDSVKVTISTTPSVNAGADVTTCPGGNISLLASGSGTYVWSPATGLSCTSCANPVANPSVSTNYTVTMTSSCGTASDSVWVVINPQFASISGTSTVCAGSSSTLSATGGGTYIWNTGATSSSIIISPTSSTGYSVTVTNASGCTANASATVTVTQAPAATASSATICAGDIATLNATGGGTYIWSTGATTSSITTSTAASYSVLVTIGNCTASATSSVTVNANPVANAASNITITQGQSANLTATGGGTYTWNNGSSSASISVTPTATTIYCVTVTNTNNCKDSACVTVTLLPEPPVIDCSNTGELYLPNSFSPNNDNENDVLQIYYGNFLCISSLSISIFDRWGEKIFESDDIAFHWDGTFNGKILDSAVFTYYLKAKLTSGKEIAKKGNISLIR